MEAQRINRVHGGMYISHFYRIYFPAFIFSMLISTFFGDLLISSIVGIDPADPLSGDLAAQGQVLLHSLIASSLLSPLFVIALADLEIRKLGMKYSDPKGMSKKGTWLTLMTTLGIYFLLSAIVKSIFASTMGRFFVIDALKNPASPDYIVVFSSSIVRIATDKPIYTVLILLSFFLTYLSIEFLLRGLIANDANNFRLGAGGVVILPAFMEGVTYTYGSLLFKSPLSYLYSFLTYFILGLMAGILFWKTRRFWSVALFAVLAFLIQPGTEFQRNFLIGLPRLFGDLRLYSGVANVIDQMGTFFGYFQVALIITSPLICIVLYQEVIQVMRELYNGIRLQWKGILVVSLAFIVIDLVFSFFVSEGNPFGAVLGYILALLVVSFAIPHVLNILPPPRSMIEVVRTPQKLSPNELYPVDVSKDISLIEYVPTWKTNQIVVAVLSAFTYLYILFVVGALRQFSLLDFNNQIRYVLFFGILPTILFTFSSYFTIRAYRRGYFFQKGWRFRLFLILGVLYVVEIFLWAVGAATTRFSWTVVPFFVAFFITIWPPRIKNPFKELSLGLTRDRAATFRWVLYDPSHFKDAAPVLMNSQIGQVCIGSYILSAKLRLIEEYELIEKLRSSSRNHEKIGLILALGIVGSKSSEGVVVDQLKDEDIEVKKAAFWALGQVGSSRVLPVMTNVLESAPSSSLVTIAEKAILKIDPDYPLSGLRDSLTMAI